MAAYLLDTNIALFATTAPERLSVGSTEAILAGTNVLSVVVYWEVVIKSMKGKLDVGEPRSWWANALAQLSATVLPIRPDHVTGVASLPLKHHDPFDRMLVAQAMVEGLTLISTDQASARYSKAGLQVIA